MTTINTIPPWKALLEQAQGANDVPHAAFAQLATVMASTQGQETRPSVRTVTVRGFIEDTHLLLTTDLRNDKVQDLLAYPACELCWYFTQTREQFRFAARAQVVGAVEARKQAKLEAALMQTWVQRSDDSRLSYMWPQPKRKRGDDVLYAQVPPTLPPDHYALIVLDVRSVDHLTLSTQPFGRTLYNKLGGQWMALAVNP